MAKTRYNKHSAPLNTGLFVSLLKVSEMSTLYTLLARLFPTRPNPSLRPRRVVLILPCCIGDVVLATATLKALRQGYPDAHITWAVGRWSCPAIKGHDLLDAILDTGTAALPVKTPGSLGRFVRQLRAGQYDLAVSLVRSPLMSLAVWLSGIPLRAGLDSGGRGFGYNLRAQTDPKQPRHEAEVYLDVARVLGLDVRECYVNVPVTQADLNSVRALLAERGINPDAYLVINPAGGRNPGMVMDSKRWPAGHFSALAVRLADKHGFGQVVLVAGPDDEALVQAVMADLPVPHAALVGTLTFGQIAALAQMARVYIGNDTGLTHLAAAAGAQTIMILGPSDPARYAPFAPKAHALWKPAALHPGGVVRGAPAGWDWVRDGLSVDEAEAAVLAFLHPD